MPETDDFRYYRWRTLYGSMLWPLDAEFYVLLGQLYLAALIRQIEQKHPLPAKEGRPS